MITQFTKLPAHPLSATFELETSSVVSSAPGAEFPVEAGRYHLYIANNCPWCHRAVLGRALLGLQVCRSLRFNTPRKCSQAFMKCHSPFDLVVN